MTQAAVALTLIVGVAAIWHFAMAKPKDVLVTVTVERGDIEKTVTAVGSLKPRDYVDVGTQVSGQLQKVLVAIGDRVSKGDLIAQIDPTRYESTVRNDRAGLDSLKAQLSQREAELVLAEQQSARNQRMLAERAISQDAAEQSTAAARVAKAAVASLKAQITAAEATLSGNLANLGYTRILAPMDGTVVSQTSLQGQTINASQSAPVIVQIANLDVMTVWAKVAEADVGRVTPGMSAYFTTLGMPGQRLVGAVRQVQPTPETLNDVVLYNVLIDVDNPDRALLPSMTVQVFFVLGEARDVPLVALNALRPLGKPGSGQYEATVKTAQGPQAREVKVGVANRTMVQVLSGLEVGDKVIVPKIASAENGSPDAERTERRRMMPRL
ncbi:MAG: efflux RND transporter periplasmic adaptor subunit [Pseudomonadota bacterium]|nr:efflux RND transporter periplasmic adaptor subunit [Pseudomonadota bacterium]